MAFDQQLSGRLIGGGDFAASVTVAVDGAIVHTGAYGVRFPVLAAPPAPAPVPPPVPGETPAATPEPPPATAAAVTPVELVDSTDRFRIASLSKVITAIVVLQLVEAGQLGLDEAVGGRLAVQVGATPVDPAGNNITVRQLLSHTAGFPSYQRAFFNASADSCPTMGRIGLSAPLQNPPGAAYLYSNLNFCLLGLLIEQVSGRGYQAVVDELLLEPLGITGMRLAGTFDAGESEVLHPSSPGRNYMEVLGAAGSWVATPSDMVRIVDSLDLTKPGFHPLSSATVDLMRQPAPPPVVYDRPDRWYGLGLIVTADGAFGHTGTIENAHSMVLHRPDGVTWSVLVSGENPWNSDQLRRIFDESIYSAGVVL
ncbi:MAG: serine hydrolase domain-containing protein [Ilumatobacteraceae bacterium]